MILWLPLQTAGAADDEVPLEDLLDLMDDEMDRSTDVADRVARSAREAAAPVTVLTGEEIRRLGARDLMDALRLLPTVEFEGDTWNTDGFLLRGNNGSDGRVLFLLDGHEWNEDLYGFMTLANRLPAEAIDRIEVIRGAGSAVYGGYAMLGVVRITTRSAEVHGGALALRGSVLDGGAYGRQDATATAGADVGESGHLGVTAVVGRGRRSEDTYRDAYGNSFDMKDASGVSPALLTARFDSPRLDASVSAERYSVTFRDGSARSVPLVHENLFSGVYGRATATFPLSEATEWRVGVASKWQEPWRSTSWSPSSYNWFKDHTMRHTASSSLVVRAGDHLTVQGGGDGGILTADPSPEDRRAIDPTRITYGDLWTQATAETAPADVTLGARLDGNSSFGAALSPRIAVGQAWRRVHYKLSANRAFRAPNAIQAQSPLDPERTTALDAEVGAAPTTWSYVTVGAWRNLVTGPMVYRYAYDPVTQVESEGYFNGTGIETAGVEGQGDVRAGGWTLGLGAAYLGTSDVQEDWAVPGEPNRALAVPRWKGVGRASWDDGGRFDAGAVFTLVGPRFGITEVNAGDPTYTELPAAAVLDLSAELRHVGLRGLSVRGTVSDVFDRNPPLPEAYYATKAPMPQTGRELLLQVAVER